MVLLNGRAAVVSILVLMLLLLADPASTQTWDLAEDFGVDENPNTVWTFGWTETLDGELHPYDLLWGTQRDSEIKGFWMPGWFGPVRAWTMRRLDESKMLALLPPPGELPYPDHWVEAGFTGAEAAAQAAGMPSYPDPFGFVSKNVSEEPSCLIEYYWEPGAVLLMPPGNQGKKAKTVVRWTAPESCRVMVKTRFTGRRIKEDAGRRAKVDVLYNGAAIYDGLINGFIGAEVWGKSPQQEWSSILSVEQGDSLDFAVGTVPGFNYNRFATVGNKQRLPAVGLAVNISVVVEEHVRAQQWVSAKLQGTAISREHTPGPTAYQTDTTEPPFSFMYNGRPSGEILKTWKLERVSKKLDSQRTEQTLTYRDPSTGLVVRCVGMEYHDFPSVEWTVYLKNTGTTDTPIIQNLQALDMQIERGPVGEFVLRMFADHPIETALTPNLSKQLLDPIAYFNVDMLGEGAIIAIGWPGQLQVDFTRDTRNGLRVQAGQTLTHFCLHPGEQVRTPLVVLQFWAGDRIDAQNVWRRWMIAHNMPRPGGELLGPQWSASSAYWYGNMVFATEENQKTFIARYLEEDLKPDYWWMDAGWYPPNITKIGKSPIPGWAVTGTWEVDTRRFPNGLRAITDYAHARGIKSILWCNQERVTSAVPTWLNENHPEWLLGADGADKLFDFGNAEAWQWAVDHFSALLKEQGIDIHRMDTMIAGGPYWRAKDAEDRQGISEINHVEGYLAFLDALLKRNPQLRLDHHRIDLETLRRSAPLILGIDFEPVGDQCHNYRLASWLPWHGLCSRVIEPYGFRSTMCPALATGWDLRRRDLDYDLARRLIGEWRSIATNYLGDFYPLTSYSLTSDVWMAWQFDRPEVGAGIVQAFRRTDSPEQTQVFKLRGLDPNTRYRVQNIDETTAQDLTGRELMDPGLSITIAAKPGAVVICYHKILKNH